MIIITTSTCSSLLKRECVKPLQSQPLPSEGLFWCDNKGERISHCLKHTHLKKVRKGWPSVRIQTECSKVRTKTTKGQYSSVWLEPVVLVSRLLYGSWKINVYLNFCSLQEKIIQYSLCLFPCKLSIWKNTNQVRSNQNTWSYVKTTSPHK